MILGNASRGKLIASSVEDAPSGWGRLWMLRRRPPSALHAWRFVGPAFWASFARAPIDVAFVDSRLRIVAAFENVRPWRGVGPVDGASGGFALEAGTFARELARVGDRIELTPTTGERVAAGAKPPEFH